MHRTKNQDLPFLLIAMMAGALAFGLTIPSAQAGPDEPVPVPEAPAPEAAPETPAPEAPAPEAAPETPAPETPPEAAPTGPSDEDMAKAKEAFVKGNALFEAKDYENAVDQFKESYKLSKNAILLYNIAFTHDEIGDKQMATFYYEKFLSDTEKGAANRDVARKRLRTLKKEAGEDVPDDVQDVTSFKHVVVDEAPPGMPLDIVAIVPEGVPWRVVMHYRPAGEAKFTSVEMHYRFKELVARIPKAATKAKNVQYYIEVEDGSGTVLERSGQPTSPHIVYMEEGAKPRFYADVTGGQTETGISGGTETPGLPGGNGGITGADGGWTDVQSSKFNKLKWGTTAGAASLILLSGTFYLISSSHSSSLEDESVDSRTGQCGLPPCNQFAQKQKDLESLGQTYETLGTVGLVLGATAAVAAGALWYLELTDDSKEERSSLITVPTIGDDYVGAAASIRF